MLRERFVCLRICHTLVQEIWVHTSIERDETFGGWAKKLTELLHFPASKAPRYQPSSFRQRRGIFPRAYSRAIAPFISLTFELPFDQRLLPFSPWQPAVEVFCNPRKWCISKGNRFHPWTRPLCTSELSVLVSGRGSWFVGNLTRKAHPSFEGEIFL